MVSAANDNKDRHRYTLCHKLMQANGLGEWNDAHYVTRNAHTALQPIKQRDLVASLERSLGLIAFDRHSLLQNQFLYNLFPLYYPTKSRAARATHYFIIGNYSLPCVRYSTGGDKSE